MKEELITDNVNTPTLKIYNTLTRNTENFTPIDEDNIRIYSCGPTVYHYAHIGNLRAYVFADILQKTIKTMYPNVTHVINITDVGHLVSDGDDGEDKLEKGSRREGKTVWDIAQYYTDAFMRDLENLNIDTEDYIFPKATDFIQEQINLIKKLEGKGYTYKTSDGVYFDTSKFSMYPDFAKLDVKNLSGGERVEMGEKKNKTDFALWKFSSIDEKRQMEWDSPWGVGFPGWHIECSAMSESILGKHFDIHTGGIDHIPVHHTNEIAQSVCAHTGTHENATLNQFVNYWMHVNFLKDNTGKMSKSNDDFLTLQKLIDQGYNPAAYRYLLLTTNYRSELAFSYDSLEAAQNALNKLTKYLHEAVKDVKNVQDAANYKVNTEYYDKFLENMYNDLNTSGALATMWEMINNKAEYTYSTVLAINRILGLNLTYVSQEKTIEDLSEEDQEKVNDLLNLRRQARENKDWSTADELREEIKKYGIEVKD